MNPKNLGALCTILTVWNPKCAKKAPMAAGVATSTGSGMHLAIRVRRPVTARRVKMTPSIMTAVTAAS